MMPSLRLRTRWVITTAALVSATGLVAVVVTTMVTERLLRSRSAGLFTPPNPFPGAPGGGPPASNPRAQADAGHAVASQVIHDVRVWGAVLVAALVVLSIVAAWFVSGRMLRPLQRIVTTARAVTTTGEGHRIASTGPRDELHELAATIDSMLDRLDRSSDAQRQFVADASHELRTPLAAMAVEIDVALDNPQADATELREALGAMRIALRRSQRLVESLLTLARAGSVEHPSRCRLDEACERAIETAIAMHRDLNVVTSLQPAPLIGDVALIDRLAANLVENAARYGALGSTVDVATGTADGRSWLRVANAGRVVDSHEVAQWFDRFRRGDRGRATSDGGVGLGLAIVRSVADAHGANVELIALPEGGIVVEVDFPAC